MNLLWVSRTDDFNCEYVQWFASYSVFPEPISRRENLPCVGHWSLVLCAHWLWSTVDGQSTLHRDLVFYMQQANHLVVVLLQTAELD